MRRDLSCQDACRIGVVSITTGTTSSGVVDQHEAIRKAASNNRSISHLKTVIPPAESH